ncbi:hypothetical protein [Acinetobacter pittii]|uniref:Uncharacterized protein n=1 Tax=Acinetobacter pittii TaxID=48296 RepID=A0AAE9M8J4_ACIPI|nr:hypothetical protein [Acinetobacter pittii]USU94169.1 hypothetical protein MWH18_17825 [Acinetobacter pittii]
MTKSFETVSAYLFACLPHIDDFNFDKRLRYVHLCDGYLAASNGFTSIIIEDEDLKGCDALIPVEAIKELEHYIIGSGKDLVDTTVNIILHGDCTGVLETKDFISINFITGAYDTINFKKLHGNKPQPYSGIPPIFNPSLLVHFQESQKYLYGCEVLGVQIFPSTQTTMAFVDIDKGIYGAIMPMDPKVVREIKTLGYIYKGGSIKSYTNRLDTNNPLDRFLENGLDPLPHEFSEAMKEYKSMLDANGGNDTEESRVQFVKVMNLAPEWFHAMALGMAKDMGVLDNIYCLDDGTQVFTAEQVAERLGVPVEEVIKGIDQMKVEQEKLGLKGADAFLVDPSEVHKFH